MPENPSRRQLLAGAAPLALLPVAVGCEGDVRVGPEAIASRSPDASVRMDEVQAAYSGPEGLEAARAFRPDAMLLDIGLPGMDGYEVARRLRESVDQRQPLLVALTGYGQATDRQRSAEAGFDHHLVKPVNADDVEMLIRRTMRSRHAIPPSSRS